MRAIWTGAINFGLVSIPVSLFSGSEHHQGLDLDMLHKKDHAPIRYARVCREDGKEIPFDEIIKGYEYQKGDYVVLEPGDFKKADAHKSESIDIVQFVNEDEIDSRYYEKPYYLEPGKGAAKSYALLREALESSNKIAVAKFVLRARENLAAVKPVGKALVLNQMRYPTDIKPATGLKFPDKKEVTPQEMKMAVTLINQMSKPFVPEDFHDTYTEELEEMIEKKAKGMKTTSRAKAPQPTKVKDLMSSLKASLDKSK